MSQNIIPMTSKLTAQARLKQRAHLKHRLHENGLALQVIRLRLLDQPQTPETIDLINLIEAELEDTDGTQ